MPANETDLLIIGGAAPPVHRLEDLGRLIDARHRLERPAIIEGVYLLDMLERPAVECDSLVYVENDADNTARFLNETLDAHEQKFKPKQETDYICVWRIHGY